MREDEADDVGIEAGSASGPTTRRCKGRASAAVTGTVHGEEKSPLLAIAILIHARAQANPPSSSLVQSDCPFVRMPLTVCLAVRLSGCLRIGLSANCLRLLLG